jgi:hypothetical protein
MPGVRYGPDISDDAAYVVDNVKELQAKLRRGAKLTGRESTTYERFANYAQDLFCVSRAEFDRGRLGELGEMARYGASNYRSKLAKSWRTGGQMKKSVEREFAERGGGVRGRGSVKTPTGKSGWYVGRTRPKRFRDLEASAVSRANANGVKFGRDGIRPGSVNPGNFRASIDRLNVAKARGGSSDITNRPRGVAGPVRKSGTTIRPSLPKSAARAQQRARKRAVAGATESLTGGGRGSRTRKR